MKVLFLFRNSEWLGIEYLSAVLKKAGHETDLLFDPGAGDLELKLPFLGRENNIQKRFLRIASEFKPDLFCFSVLTNLFPWCRKMVAFLKEHFPAVPIIAGGVHTTMFPEDVINTPGIDMVCIGEGEDALLELCNSMQNGEIRNDISNIWTKENGKINRSSLRPLIQNIDDLPYPDKDIFYQYGCFSSRLYVMTGRGCPYNCSYCFNHTYREMYKEGGKYLRRSSVERSIEELIYFKSRYKIREVYFYDDTFTLDHPWVKEFCESYMRHVGLPFSANIRSNTVNREIIKSLKKAGCYVVKMGVESGDEYVRNNIMKRNLTDKSMLEAARYIHSEGIKLCTLNFVGVPHETPEQMWKTVDFNWQLNPNGGSMINSFYPFPKTELFHLSVKSGYLDSDGVKKVISGEGGYRSESILTSPHADTITKVMIYGPIMVRLPKFLHPLFKKLPPLLPMRLLSILFYAPFRHLYYRMKEFFFMQYFSLFNVSTIPNKESSR